MDSKGAIEDELYSGTLSANITSSSKCARRAAVFASIAIICVVSITAKGQSSTFLQDASQMTLIPEAKLLKEAKLAEQAERYDDMISTMTTLVKQSPVLTDESRNLFSVAFKNVVGARRSSWRIISSIVQKKTE
jgi:hypothetical protein